MESSNENPLLQQPMQTLSSADQAMYGEQPSQNHEDEPEPTTQIQEQTENSSYEPEPQPESEPESEPEPEPEPKIAGPKLKLGFK